MPTSATGSSLFAKSRGRGFSLVELLVVLTIVGLVVAATAPASSRFYDSIQSRKAVRDAVGLLTSARTRALSSGVAQDVRVQPAERRIWLGDREYLFPESTFLTVHGAAELNLDNVGVIRFYPDGSSSGGGVDISRADGSGTRIEVDWLIGRVRTQPLNG